MQIEKYDLANAHKRLALLRGLAKAGLTDVAQALNVSPDELSRWEREGLPIDNLLWCHTIVERACRRFHCSLKWLREGVGVTPTDVVFAKTVFVEAECGPCNGSGVYPGEDVYPFGEIPDEEKVVCRRCDGNGKYAIEYVPFNKRYQRTDVVRVHTNHLSKHRGSVSYEQFLAGARP